MAHVKLSWEYKHACARCRLEIAFFEALERLGGTFRATPKELWLELSPEFPEHTQLVGGRGGRTGWFVGQQVDG